MRALLITLLASCVVAGQLSCNSKSSTDSNIDSGRPTPARADLAAELIAASKAAGIKIIERQVFTISRNEETFASAPLAAWVHTPATELRTGTDIAFAYVSTKDPNVPRGYYTIRAYADEIRVGTVTGKVQLIDRAGKVAAEIPSQAEIHSLTVPANARTAFVTTGAAPSDGRIRLWHRCDNGACYLFPMFRDPSTWE